MKQLVLATVPYMIISLPLSFEVHFFANNECIYDQVYLSFQFDVIKQIFIDYDKYGK